MGPSGETRAKGPANRMGTRMIALCSAAVGLVYTAGYAVTYAQEPDQAARLGKMAANSPAPAGAPAQPRGPERGRGQDRGQDRGHVRSRDRSRDRSRGGDDGWMEGDHGTPNVATTPAPVLGPLHDGTFAGTGRNRIGSVTVAVTIKSGKIAEVTITNCTTRHPCSRIAGLPEQVVARQGERVDVVSGATLSTDDFRMAVQQALVLAQAGT